MLGGRGRRELIRQKSADDHDRKSYEKAKKVKKESTYLELGVVSHHTLETDTNTLNDTKEDGAHNGRVTGGLDTTANSQRTTSEETSDN